MAIRLLVDRVSNIQAVISTRSLRIVSPQFRAAAAVVTRRAYSATLAYPLYQTSVNYRRLANLLSYRDIQTSDLVLDADTKNRYFRDLDSIGFADAASLNVSTKLDVLGYLSDQIAIGSQKSLLDTFTVTDFVAVLLILQRAFFDSFPLSDSSFLQVGKTPQDTIGFADFITAKGFIKARTDTATLVDTRAVISFSRIEADGFSVADFYSAVVQYSRTFIESIGVVSDVRPVLDIGLGRADQLLPADALAYDLDTSAADGANVSDLYASEFSRPASDSTSVNDLFERVVVYSRAFEDAFTLDDSTTVDGVIKDTYAVKTNVFGFSDESVFDFSKAVNDYVEASDLFTYSASTQLSDTFVVNESLVVAKRSTASSVLNVGALNSAPFNN